MKIYYGEKGQDKWVIEAVLNQKTHGFFLDTGASDGINSNNTFILEKEYNWEGIAIEPNPHYYEQLVKNRSCITENIVLSHNNAKVKMRTDNGTLGGIVADDTDNSIAVRGDQLKSENCKIIEAVPALLHDVLDKHNAPKEIDYWSLDIEGSEERVISSFDFSKYKFGCITIERPTPLGNKILQNAGYVFVNNFKYDSFYVLPKYSKNLKLEKFEQIPKKDW